MKFAHVTDQVEQTSFWQVFKYGMKQSQKSKKEKERERERERDKNKKLKRNQE